MQTVDLCLSSSSSMIRDEYMSPRIGRYVEKTKLVEDRDTNKQ